jgi:YfiR/HmsC-like
MWPMATRRCSTTTEPRARRLRSACTAAALALVHAVAAVRPVHASPADDEARILLRAISFDRALAGRAGDEVVISVVYDGRASGGERERDGRVLAFRKLADRTIAGLPMRVTSSDCTSSRPLDEALRGVDIVYLTSGAKECVRAVTAVTRRLRIASLTSERALVAQGVTIGVTIEGARPKLLVNLKASKAEGLDLASQMLQLAEVIK